MADLIRTASTLGEQQVIAGTSDKNFVIQTRGKVKIQQGSKFIDLIKDGKLNTPNVFIIVNTFNDIGTSTAFYYVRDENSLYAVVEGNIVAFESGTGGSGTGGVDKLEDLSDVTIFNVRNGDFLTYANGVWTNSLFNVQDLEFMKSQLADITNNVSSQLQFTQRTWADIQQTLEMMFDPEGSYFTEKIKPLAVETAYLVVGTNSQQFDLVNITFKPNYLKNYQQFNVEHTIVGNDAYLLHNTYSREGENPETQAGNRWDIPTTEITFPDDDPYYIYARCDKYGPNGAIVHSKNAIEVDPGDDDPNYLYFWIGVVNSPQNDVNIDSSDNVNGLVRSWAPMHGFTEIAGQYITTGVIRDQAGMSYWDMIDGKFRMGDAASYIYWDGSTLHIKGRLVQDDPHYTNYIVNWRGFFQNSSLVKYEPGDVVYYNGSAYFCVAECYGNIIPGTNANYWQLLTAEGQGYEFRWLLTATDTRPADPNTNSSWTTSNDLEVSEDFPFLWIAYRTYYTVSNGGRSYSGWTVTLMSNFAEDGEIGPTMVFRGTYEAASTGTLYYANRQRADIVKYGSVYYLANYKELKDTTQGINGFNVTPGSTITTSLGTTVPAWTQFGASFTSVATGLLFAETAIIAGWNFFDNYIWSADGNAVLYGKINPNKISYQWAITTGLEPYFTVKYAGEEGDGWAFSSAEGMTRINNIVPVLGAGVGAVSSATNPTTGEPNSILPINMGLRLYDNGIIYGSNLWFQNANIVDSRIGGFRFTGPFMAAAMRSAQILFQIDENFQCIIGGNTAAAGNMIQITTGKDGSTGLYSSAGSSPYNYAIRTYGGLSMQTYVQSAVSGVDDSDVFMPGVLNCGFVDGNGTLRWQWGKGVSQGYANATGTSGISTVGRTAKGRYRFVFAQPRHSRYVVLAIPYLSRGHSNAYPTIIEQTTAGFILGMQKAQYYDEIDCGFYYAILGPPYDYYTSYTPVNDGAMPNLP